MNWTESQSSAITNRNKNLLISAGAGCGKTAVLTHRILSLMLETKTDIDSFVVATFTKAAAAQMKDKIRGLLYDKLKENEDENKEFIYRQISLLDNANISTIHSFCIKILREYYYILDIDPSFKIIDETSAALIKNEELDKIFEKHYEENDNEFINTALSYSSGIDDAGFKELLTEIYRFIYNRPSPMKWLNMQVEKFNAENKNKDFQNALEVIKEAINDSLEQSLALNEKAKELTRLCMKESSLEEDKLIDFLIDEESLIKTLIALLESDFRAFLEHDKKPFSRFPRTKLETEDKDKIKALRDQSKLYGEDALSLLTFPLDDLEKISKNLYEPMKNIENILIEFDTSLKQRKSEEGVMEFSDIEHLTTEVLLNKEANEKIKKQFKYIFVDEYQDTNLVQEEIINLISSDNNLFTVGDIKQSIYRFRQAEPSIFYERYKKYQQIDAENINKLIFMQTNFRSSEKIITGLNYLFENLMSEQVGGINYTENESLESGKENSAKLKTEIHLLEPEEQDETFEAELETLKGDELEITHALHTVKELLHSGEIYDKKLKQNRKIEPKDICILSRSDTNITGAVTDIFSRNSLPVKVSKESNYYETPEIELIKDILKLTNNLKDDITLLAVMRSFIFAFTADELLEIRLTFDKKELPFYHECVLAYLENSETLNTEIYKKIKHMNDIINDFKERALYMDIPSLIRYIYNKTHMLEYMSALRFGEKKKSNLETFIVLAMQYESFSESGLYGFLNFIEYAKKSGNQGEINSGINSDENAVTFMSIHKSKGLEFPVVILIRAGKNFSRESLKGQILLSKDIGLGSEYVNLDEKYKVDSAQRIACKILEEKELLSEEMRLLYVAATRAEEKLIITGRIKETKSGFNEINTTIPSKAKNFLDWIGYALDINITDMSCNNTEDFEIIRKKLPSIEAITDTTKRLAKHDLDNKTIHNIKEHLAFEYNKSSYKIPSKLTVSEISDETLLEVGEEVIPINETPNFMIKSEEYNAVKKGNLIHFILEIIDLEKISEKNIRGSIDAQIDNFIKEERITKKDLDNLDKTLLYSFFESAVGKNLLHAEKIYRELPFNLSLKAKDLSDRWSDNSEDVLIQGIIDCLFIDKNNNYIILDYKTGKSNLQNKEIFLKYKKQIQLYSAAVEKILGKKVYKSYLCFLSENKYEEII